MTLSEPAMGFGYEWVLSKSIKSRYGARCRLWHSILCKKSLHITRDQDLGDPVMFIQMQVSNLGLKRWHYIPV